VKPAPFDLVRPATAADAASSLHEAQGDAKILAGGQSLIPLLNFRLASPRLLVDLNGVEGLSYIHPSDAMLEVGSMTRLRAVERSAWVADRIPILTNALSWVGHVQIRNRGTVGGSLAHADPAAELPALALLLDGSVRVIGPSGERTLAVDDLLLGFLTTSIEEDELVTEVQFRVPDQHATWGFREFAPRHGDFAFAGAAVLVTPDDQGRTSEARVVVFGGPDRALRAPESERALTGLGLTADLIEQAAEIAATETLVDDPRPDAPYRRRLTQAMVGRALRDAMQRGDPG
jgi:carbon-monoxide dehydrogenase medium subunit